MMGTGTVISAINGMRWDLKEWQVFRVAANQDDERRKNT